MNVVKYDPFRDLRSLQDEVNRLFSGAAAGSGSREEMFNGSWNPRVDIYENENSLVLEAELPGMTSSDFELSFENNVLTLHGERKFEKNAEGDNYHRIERAYGQFTRSFTLPQTVTAEGADAQFKDGILRVTLAKREETKARKIEIKSAEQPAQMIEAEKGASASA